MPPVTLLGVLGFAILALLFSQREAVGRMFPHVPAHAASAPVVPAPVEPIDVAPVVPNPLARVAPNQHSTRTPKTAQPRTSSGGGYAIAVGNYPTREMAMSECDYLGRLVTLRVHVAPAGAGKRGYRLLLGKYDDTEAAEVALHRLQGRGVATDAKVVEVPSAQNETHARHRRR